MNTRTRSLFLLIITLMLLIIVTTTYASTPNPGEGNFTLIADPVINSVRQANGNMIMNETLVFAYDGTMVGESIADVTCLAKPTGQVVCHGREVFTGSVEGKSGTFVFQAAVKIDETGQLKGQWVVLKGTSDLANLKGEGTVAGTTASGSYTLNFHFDPN